MSKATVQSPSAWATRANLGERLHPQTDAENAASVVPSDLAEVPGNIRRTGAQDGGASRTAVQAAIDQCQQGGAEKGAASVHVPQGAWTIEDSQLTVTESVTIQGEGYHSRLVLPPGATHRLFLCQHPSFGPIYGAKIRDLHLDGNGGGALDSGLLQCNNLIGAEIRGNFIENGDLVSGTRGVNGIAMSSGTPGGAGFSGVVDANYVRGMSKAGINYTSFSESATISSNFVREGAGTGIVPGLQINGGFRCRAVFNSLNNNEGPGIVVAADTLDNPPLYTLLLGNHVYRNGRGNGPGGANAEGDGIKWKNINTPTNSTGARGIIAFNFLSSNGEVATSGTRSGATLQNDRKIDFIGNYVDGNWGHGVVVQHSVTEVQDVRILGNVFENNNLANAAQGAAVLLLGRMSRIRIAGNAMRNTDGVGRQKYGVYVHDSCVIDELIIKDNDVIGMETAEYYLGPSGAIITRMDLDLRMRKQTVGGSPSTVLLIPIAVNSAAMIEIDAVAQKDGGGAVAAYKRAALVYRAGASAAIEGGADTAIFERETTAGYAAQITVSGNNAAVLVNGVTGETVNWIVRIRALSAL